MKFKKKGDYGYIKSERIKRGLITFVMFLIPIVIFITGLYRYHDRKNILTLIAIMGCLPASKFAVDLILICMQKPLPEALYKEISSHVKDMTAVYETSITTYEKTSRFACVVISGLHVIAYSADPKIDGSAAEKYMKKIIQGNGYRANVKVFSDLKPFLRRVDEIYVNHEQAEKEVPFTPNEDYPDATRNDLVKAVILAISI